MGFLRIAGAIMAMVCCAQTAGAAEPTATELAQSLQRRIDGIRDFSADFTHTYQGGVLHKVVTERGRLLMKKPGKMRWDYTVPEPKLFVSDGVKMYSYVPEDKQVIITDVPAEGDTGAAALFLAGRGSLVRDYTPSLVDLPPGMPPGSRALKLVPRSRQQDEDSLILVIDPTSLAMRGLVTQDAQGGISSFSFVNLKENVGVTDKEFAFKMPRGVDVITPASRH